MIRMIQEEDIPLLLSWYNRYIREGVQTFEIDELTLEEFRERVHAVRQKYPWIILEEEGKPVGYAYLGSFMTRAAYNWTCDLSIYLDPEERGKGYGRKLMEEIISLARRDGFRTMVSIITEGNTASEHIHESFGFTCQGRFPDFGYKFGRWLGISYYTLELQTLPDEFDQPRNLNPYIK